MLTRVSRVLLAVVALVAFAGAAQAADDAWSKLKVGDWVKYKVAPAPGIETQQKWTVKEVTADKVVYAIETTTLMNGAAVGSPVSTDMTYDKKNPAAAMGAGAATAPGAEAKITDETVKVGDKELKVKVMASEGEANGQKYSAKVYTSDEVPFGIVKTESNGQVSMELVEFGHGS
jgi:hypothetical protein